MRERSHRLAKLLWAAPCTAAGLCLAIPALLFGARARIVDGVIEISVPALDKTSGLRTLFPFNAITFGHLVIGGGEAMLDRLRTHEHAHVRQYERWGVFFFAAYPASSLWQLLRGRRPYFDNRFEVEARAASRLERNDAGG